jgi:hypothetical protein
MEEEIRSGNDRKKSKSNGKGNSKDKNNRGSFGYAALRSG